MGSSSDRLPAVAIVSRELLEAWHARIRLARPFLKWAGGKQRFLLSFADRLPDVRGTYIEPFLGSGAVFFKLMSRQSRPGGARLGDINRQLIQTFIAVRDQPDDIRSRLERMQAAYSEAANKTAYYLEQRRTYNATLPKPDPALLIFLNHTCWNGLYRVNRAGRFNVPYGAPKTEIVIPDREELLNASAALAQANLRATSWQNLVAFAQKGDFVFLDPPYYSELVNETSRSTKYQTARFSLRDHQELARSLVDLDRRGIDFVLTNSGEDQMRKLYESSGLRVAVIQAPRSINSKTDKRGPVRELVVTSTRHSVEQPDQLAWMLTE